MCSLAAKYSRTCRTLAQAFPRWTNTAFWLGTTRLLTVALGISPTSTAFLFYIQHAQFGAEQHFLLINTLRIAIQRSRMIHDSIILHKIKFYYGNPFLSFIFLNHMTCNWIHIVELYNCCPLSKRITKLKYKIGGRSTLPSPNSTLPLLLVPCPFYWHLAPFVIPWPFSTHVQPFHCPSRIFRDPVYHLSCRSRIFRDPY